MTHVHIVGGLNCSMVPHIVSGLNSGIFIGAK